MLYQQPAVSKPPARLCLNGAISPISGGAGAVPLGLLFFCDIVTATLEAPEPARLAIALQQPQIGAESARYPGEAFAIGRERKANAGGKIRLRNPVFPKVAEVLLLEGDGIEGEENRAIA